MIRLGVNVDHVATVRNARGGAHPDPVAAALAAVAAGADGITAHLREDRRHIRDADLARLRAEIGVPLNMEMAATAEMVAIALRLRPNACCIVPERRAEVTTEGGLDAAGQRPTRAPMVRVSLFIDPELHQLEAAAALRADIVELHTGAYAEEDGGAAENELARLRVAAVATAGLGLECHAGHGLTYGNVGPVAALPEVVELNIGHFLIGQAILDGIPAVIAEMKRRIAAGRAQAAS
jgi:pyridoxine 5-phosphate synthase